MAEGADSRLMKPGFPELIPSSTTYRLCKRGKYCTSPNLSLPKYKMDITRVPNLWSIVRELLNTTMWIIICHPKYGILAEGLF